MATEPSSLASRGLLLLWFYACSPELSKKAPGMVAAGDAGIRGDFGFVPPGAPDVRPAGLADALYDPSACPEETFVANPEPLDLLLVVDTSGSMASPLAGDGTGTTKWSAVKKALIAFINDPRSATFGVGLQYFPSPTGEPPTRCTDSDQCGKFGPCEFEKVCSGTGQGGVPLKMCQVEAECPVGSTCGPLGRCQGGDTYCTVVGSACIGPSGTVTICERLPGTCQNAARSRVCDIKDYSTPSVGITDLPQGAAALIESLEKRNADGVTPMGLALIGGIAYIRSPAVSSRGRRTVVVIATDGLPSGCMPDINGIARVLADARAGTPAIGSYVIGVLSDMSSHGEKPALELLASAGGTGGPLLVTPGQDLTAQFLDALNQIRNAALPCEYQLPAREGLILDLGKVNISFTPPTGPATRIPYVGDQTSCDAKPGGWYYDVDPSTAQMRRRIVVCGTTCELFKAGGGGKVEIVYGCKTKVIE